MCLLQFEEVGLKPKTIFVFFSGTLRLNAPPPQTMLNVESDSTVTNIVFGGRGGGDYAIHVLPS